jgi:lipopolysaccharide biosynthesis protein
LQLGHVLKLQGKSDEAEAAYLRAFALDSRLHYALDELGGLGWSDAELSELRRVAGMDSIAPAGLSNLRDTVPEPMLTSSKTDHAAGRKRQDFASHHASRHPSTVERPVHAGYSFHTAQEAEDAQLIAESDVFDTTWYTKAYNGWNDADLDPVLHYLRSGAGEGRDPHPLFDSDWYLANNPDVAAKKVNPLVHYLRFGAGEGRAPNPLLTYVFSGSPRILSPTISSEVCVPDLFELRGLVPRGRIAVVLHLYYADLWNEMRQAIQHISEPFDLFVSLVRGMSEQHQTQVKEAFPNAYVFEFENRGRDIGPFLAFLESGVLFRYELVCKLHTKLSAHRQDGDTWRRALIDGVLGSPVLIGRILSNFRIDPDLGMVVADGNIFRGYEHWTSNGEWLAELLPRIGISPDVKHRSFPGGSIFWIRPFLLRTLSGVGLALGDFEPEPVKMDGSLAHAVERVFGLICEDAGMRVVESGQLTQDVHQPAQELGKVHLIAFYLPQFHPIPENDEWWGAGFTEWTNVTRSKPLFSGHRQPRLPSDLGFYDLRLPEVRIAQANLARRYGLTAFCYYYYWFNGRRILERPLKEVLASKKPDFPFLICWANEPWTRNWDGYDRDVLLPQTYKPGWPKQFARDIAPMLRDYRYFRVNGEPMLLIYRIGHIPEAEAAMRELRAALSKEGILHVHLAAAWVWFPEDDELPANPNELDLDAYFEIPPHWLPAQPLHLSPSRLSEKFTGELKDYNRTVSVALAKLDEPLDGRRHRGVMAGWDPTARKGSRSVIFHGATPTSFRRWLRGTVAHEREQEGERIVFINAWNEWAEGAYLEPDRDFGHGWLEAVASVAGFEGGG